MGGDHFFTLVPPPPPPSSEIGVNLFSDVDTDLPGLEVEPLINEKAKESITTLNHRGQTN